MVLRWQGVVKRFGAQTALKGVSLDVKPGERVALLGANGSGKTTLLRVAAGLCRPDRGTVVVAGFDVRKRTREARAHMGYMPQRVDFSQKLTVAETLTFFANLRKVAAARAAEVAENLGLGDLLGKRTGELSGGMAQRLALAVTLLADPAVLLLDEPTAGLDPAHAGEVRRLLRRASARGCATVMATHQFEDIGDFADRVVMLDEGELVVDQEAGRVLEAIEASGTPRRVVDPASLLRIVARVSVSQEGESIWNGPSSTWR